VLQRHVFQRQSVQVYWHTSIVSFCLVPESFKQTSARNARKAPGSTNSRLENSGLEGAVRPLRRFYGGGSRGSWWTYGFTGRCQAAKNSLVNNGFCNVMPGPFLRNGLNLKNIFTTLDGQLTGCNLHSGISPNVEIPAFYSTLPL